MRRRRALFAHATMAARAAWADVLEHCDAQLRQRCVKIPRPFDLEEFRAGLEAQRGRPLFLNLFHAPPTKNTTCGICIPTASADHGYYLATPSNLHRSHNAVHEIAHLILEHRSTAATTRSSLAPAWARSAALAQALLGELGPAGGTYGGRSEDEADAVAALLLGSWRDPPPRRWIASTALRIAADQVAEGLA